MIIDITCILIVLFFYYKWFKRPLNEVYFLFMFIYQGFWIICSLVFLENTSIYMIETDRNAYRVYATPIYTIFHLTSIYVFIKSFKYFKVNYSLKIPLISTKQQIFTFRVIFIILYTGLIINLVLSPIPFFIADGSDDIYSRFDYWKNSRFPILSIFGETSAILIVIASIFLLHKRKEGILYMILYIIYIILLGHKFGTIFNLIFVFFLPFILLSKNLFFRLRIKTTILIILTSLGAVYISFLNYSNYNPYSNVDIAETPFLAVLYRAFALQSQLVWLSIEQNIFLSKTHTFNVSDILYGMHNMMNKYTMADIAVGKHKGSQLTNGYPSILIEIFPVIIALFINIIFYIFYAYVISLSFFTLRAGNYFGYIIAYYCISFTTIFLSMGNLVTIIPAILFVLGSLFFIRRRA